MAMINHRVCIYAPEGQAQKSYSIKEMTACAQKNGCKSGTIQGALDYWQAKGLVTGGGAKVNKDACQPLYVNQSELLEAKCLDTCDNGAPMSKEVKSYGSKRYEIKSKNEEEIMKEIFLYGPVIATMQVFQDFIKYGGGIYIKNSNENKGGHAVVLLGWGVEGGEKFWLGASSWGFQWGEKGFFKIRRGTDESKIESAIHAALPIEAVNGETPPKTSEIPQKPTSTGGAGAAQEGSKRLDQLVDSLKSAWNNFWDYVRPRVKF